MTSCCSTKLSRSPSADTSSLPSFTLIWLNKRQESHDRVQKQIFKVVYSCSCCWHVLRTDVKKTLMTNKSFIPPPPPSSRRSTRDNCWGLSLLFFFGQNKPRWVRSCFPSLSAPLCPRPACWCLQSFTRGNSLIDQINKNRVHMNSVDCVYHRSSRRQTKPVPETATENPHHLPLPCRAAAGSIYGTCLPCIVLFPLSVFTWPLMSLVALSDQ